MALVRRGPHAVDIGPAAASGVDGIAALGRLSAVKGSDSGSLEVDTGMAAGVGPVERRKATPEELARLDAPEAAAGAAARVGPAMHLLRPAAAAMAASRVRGNERMLESKGQRPAPRSAQGTVDDRSERPGRVVGTPARTEAPPPTTTPKEEPMAIEAAPPATPFAGVQIPCTDCLHEPVCYLKRELPGNPNLLAEPMELGPGLRLVTTGVRIECDHQLVSLRPAAAEPIRAEYGGESWRTSDDGLRPLPWRTAAGTVPEPKRQPGHHQSKKAEEAEKRQRAAAAVAALARHGGDRRAAAAACGMKLNAFSMVLKFAERRQAVPA